MSPSSADRSLTSPRWAEVAAATAMEHRTLTLRRVRLTDDTTTDVEVDEETGTIARVGQDLDPSGPGRAIDLKGYLLLPAPAEPHAHLDKAFLAERIPNPSGDLAGAIVAMDANRASLTAIDIADRAERAARMMVANGITAIRSHADTMTGHGLRSVEGLVAARERLAGLVDLQIVALVSWPVTGTAGAEHRALLEAALEAGADVVGGCPHLDDDPDGANEVLLEIAADHGLMVDLHTDETLNPCVLGLRDLAARVAKSGFPHQVTASHCVSLGVQPLALQREVAAEVAAAGVGVVTLPQTNLYLQSRDVPVAPPRGLTAVRPLLEAGATVAAGADNLQDPFNLVGRADPMETAALMVMAGHLLPAEAYLAVSASSRALLGLPPVRIEPGAPAELLAIRADSLREAIATAPLDRLVIHAGRLVSRTRVTSDP